MKGGRRPEKLVQALGQQRVFAAFFVGNLMTRRARRGCPSWGCPTPASGFTGGGGGFFWGGVFFPRGGFGAFLIGFFWLAPPPGARGGGGPTPFSAARGGRG